MKEACFWGFSTTRSSKKIVPASWSCSKSEISRFNPTQNLIFLIFHPDAGRVYHFWRRILNLHVISHRKSFVWSRLQSASSGFIRPEDGQVVIFLLGELGEFLKFALKYSKIMSLGVIWYEEFEKNVFIAVALLRTSVSRDYTGVCGYSHIYDILGKSKIHFVGSDFWLYFSFPLWTLKMDLMIISDEKIH